MLMALAILLVAQSLAQQRDDLMLARRQRSAVAPAAHSRGEQSDPQFAARHAAQRIEECSGVELR